MPHQTSSPSNVYDAQASSYIMYIYHEYIESNKDNLPSLVRVVLGEDERINSEEIDSTKEILDWFFSERSNIETWYQNNGKSYQKLWKDCLKQQIQQALITALGTKDDSGIDFFLGPKTSSLYKFFNEVIDVPTLCDKVKKGYKFYIDYKQLVEEGRQYFKGMVKDGAELSKIQILTGFLALSLHENKIREKDDLLLRKLLDCCWGDIKNRHAFEFPVITIEELGQIYQNNPEVRRYLLAFIDAFHQIPQGLSPKSVTIFTQQYRMLLNVIREYETRYPSDEYFLLPNNLSISGLSASLTASAFSEELSKEGVRDLINMGVHSSNVEERTAESSLPVSPTTDSESSAESHDAYSSVEIDETTPKLSPEELISNYDGFSMEVYCHYHLSQTNNRIEIQQDPKTAGKIAALNFFLVAKNSANSLLEFISKHNLAGPSVTDKTLSDFWYSFFYQFSDPTLLGKYDNEISHLFRRSRDFTFLSFLLAFHLQKIDVIINKIKDDLSEANAQEFFETLLEETINQWEETFKLIGKPTFAEKLQMFAGINGLKATRYQRLQYEIACLAKLPSQIKQNFTTDYPKVRACFLKLSTLKTGLVYELPKVSKKNGREAAVNLVKTSQKMVDVLKTLALKEHIDEFLNGFIDEIRIISEKKQYTVFIDALRENDSVFAAIMIADDFSEVNLLKDAICEDFTFQTPLLNRLLSKLITALQEELTRSKTELEATELLLKFEKKLKSAIIFCKDSDDLYPENKKQLFKIYNLVIAKLIPLFRKKLREINTSSNNCQELLNDFQKKLVSIQSMKLTRENKAQLTELYRYVSSRITSSAYSSPTLTR